MQTARVAVAWCGAAGAMDMRNPGWFKELPGYGVHVDLNVRVLADEVERLAALGAERPKSTPARAAKPGVVMRDPEGNQFCLVQVARN